MKNLLIENTEIRNQKHEMIAEGTCDLQPNKNDIVVFVQKQNYCALNIEIWFDNMQGFYRWNCDIINL